MADITHPAVITSCVGARSQSTLEAIANIHFTKYACRKQSDFLIGYMMPLATTSYRYPQS